MASDSSDEFGNFDLLFDMGDNQSTSDLDFFPVEEDESLLAALAQADSEWLSIATPDVGTAMTDAQLIESGIGESETDDVQQLAKRFPSLSNKDLEEIENKATSSGTKKQTKWGVGLFKQWLTENEQDTSFESLSEVCLDKVLRRFYGSLRTANGSLYSKSAFVGIRAAISRHLMSPPYSLPYNILQDKAFVSSNNMFKAMLLKLKREGCEVTEHHKPISASDMERLRSSSVLSTLNPRGLLRKVWFDITLSFARRGRENLRQLTPASFQFGVDEAHAEYVQMSFNEPTKNHPGDNLKDRDFESRPRMYATGDNNCPVTSLKKYLGKRNPDNDIFFQQPKAKVTPDADTWYTARPVGQRLLNDMMKTISSEAGLSMVYTNHCVRATTITLLSHAGVEAREIMRIAGHRNEQSIRSYNTDSSETQKRQYSSNIQGQSSAAVPDGQVSVPSRQVLAPLPSTSVQTAYNININNQLVFPCPAAPTPYTYQKQFEINNSTVNIYNYYYNSTAFH